MVTPVETRGHQSETNEEAKTTKGAKSEWRHRKVKDRKNDAKIGKDLKSGATKEVCASKVALQSWKWLHLNN